MRWPRRESDIQRAILAHCNRLPGVVLWRANSGAVTATYKGKMRFVRFNGMPGMSDLIGWRTRTSHGRMCATAAAGGLCTCPNAETARFIAIEVKCPGKQATPLQASFLDMVRKAGGLAIVASSVEDVIKKGLR